MTVPGICRRLEPKKGSGTAPAAACAANTVLGTEVPIHPSVAKSGAEMLAPSALALQADCIFHPSCRGVTVAACNERGRVNRASQQGARVFAARVFMVGTWNMDMEIPSSSLGVSLPWAAHGSESGLNLRFISNIQSFEYWEYRRNLFLLSSRKTFRPVFSVRASTPLTGRAGPWTCAPPTLESTGAV